MSDVVRLLASPQSSELSDDQISTHIKRVLNSSELRTWQMTLSKGYRLRRLDESGLQTDLAGLEGKPAPHERHGRCNTLETSVFYAATDLETALMEQRAVAGDLFQVLEVAPVGDQRFAALPVGWMDYFRRFKQPPAALKSMQKGMADAIREWMDDLEPEKITRLFLLDAFLADEFKKVVRADEGNQYRNTAFYSSLLLEEGAIELILYPSVQNFGGWNVAIHPNRVWERMKATSVKLIRVDRALGYGLYNCSEILVAEVAGRDISWPDSGQ